jgi:hypothetical protein
MLTLPLRCFVLRLEFAEVRLECHGVDTAFTSKL